MKRNLMTSAFLIGVAAAGLGAGVASAAPAAEWTVVWQDDFSGDTLDRTKWKPEKSCWGGGNEERQCYTDRTENVYVKEGALHLHARREEFTGPLYPEGMRPGDEDTGTKPYTSGKVRTRGIADWQYGRFSARIRLPQGQGVWPAFWMMPAHDAYGGWPLSGEIDIMEAVNLGTPCEEKCPAPVETRTSGAIHFGERPPENTYLASYTNGTLGMSGDHARDDEWHVYSVEWAEGVIQWFVDGEIFMRLDEADWYSAAADHTAAPFDQPFYLMLNLAVGGRYPEESNGKGFEAASFPATMEVDWVRVEQCEGDLETGLACLSSAEWDGAPFGPDRKQD